MEQDFSITLMMAWISRPRRVSVTRLWSGFAKLFPASAVDTKIRRGCFQTLSGNRVRGVSANCRRPSGGQIRRLVEKIGARCQVSPWTCLPYPGRPQYAKCQRLRSRRYRLPSSYGRHRQGRFVNISMFPPGCSNETFIHQSIAAHHKKLF